MRVRGGWAWKNKATKFIYKTQNCPLFGLNNIHDVNNLICSCNLTFFSANVTYYGWLYLADLTCCSDLALRAPDWPPGFAQGHECCGLGWLLLPYILLPRRQGPWASSPCVSGSRLPPAFTTYGSVLQQLPGTHSPAGVRGQEAAGGVRAVWRGVGVGLHGGFSRCLCAASGVVLRWNGDIDHVVAKHRWVKDLGETTKGADWGAGGQGGGGGVGIGTLVGWCRTSVCHCWPKIERRGFVLQVEKC